MDKDFAEKLDDLINDYMRNLGWQDEVISALELKLMALREEAEAADG